MSYLTLSISGTRIQFYCEHCYDEDYEEPETQIKSMANFLMYGAPDCDRCNNTMEPEYILVPPSDAIEENHI